MDVKLCPRCNKLPNVKVTHGLRYMCVMSCGTLGCKLYYPIITLGFNKEKTMKKAAERWNAAVDRYDDLVL